ncbi:MAG: acetyl-CoA carboxylase biotin carboxyl carrier protein subunit [Crocinitomicaceae bacterium]|jgi:biotin carboxyl carrier protein|nr:acetyl-CoA carboxylase biotin carboxyl carrier protein subunit [Crocinitomicaceae bacterium]MBP6033793.1 acetyl-CoA carboxylase biotin carboxyl carrier protein subunit [Crocinitomicaceae bacterium]
MNNWIFDGKDMPTAGGAAITWHDHRFFDITHNGVVFHGEIVQDQSENRELTIKINHRVFQVKRKGELDEIIASLGFDKPKIRKLKELAAPMPGRVTSIHIELGQEIQPGDPILSLEAMKMENVLKAEGIGVVSAINIQQGDVVEKGSVLVSFE